MSLQKLALLLVTAVGVACGASGSTAAAPRCVFEVTRGEFKGTAIEQARCLLPEFNPPLDRRDESGGHTRATLGSLLEGLVGKTVNGVNPARLANTLAGAGLPDAAQTLSRPLSSDSKGRRALYFVIHDTSTPFGFASFPPDDAPSMTRLGEKWPSTGNWEAHAWVNRLGAARITYDFGTRIPQAATKFELGHPELLGRFLHTELTQSRRSRTNNVQNDAGIPIPAFTNGQYDAVALLYILASVRAGNWLIPAYHAAIDWGFSANSHDDPQHFDLAHFSTALDGWLSLLK